MTIHASFYNGGTYLPEDFMEQWNDWVTPGVINPTDLQVTAQSPVAMAVNVNGAAQGSSGGNAYLPGGYRLCNDAVLSLTIATASTTYPRIDLVCAGINTSTTPYTPTIQVITGTAASSPTVPVTPTGYIALAQVYVSANATSISGSNITDMRTLATLKGSGVTSFNGQTGAVTYTDSVTSVNGLTGAVTIQTIPGIASPNFW